MLNNSYTKTNTIFGQALGCTALDDAFVKLLSDVNADGVTQFLIRTCSRLVLCNIYKLFFIMGGRFVMLLSSGGVRIADNESIGQNPNTRNICRKAHQC